MTNTNADNSVTCPACLSEKIGDTNECPNCLRIANEEYCGPCHEPTADVLVCENCGEIFNTDGTIKRH